MLLAELSAQAPAACKLLMARRQYKTCHIRVPDLEQHLSAIQTGQEFYSFYRVFPEPQKLLTVIAKLGNRGDRMAITQTAKGYTLWVLEPDAQPVRGAAAAPGLLGENPAQAKFLPTQALYYPCMIQVPPDRNYLALAIEGQFYRFFKLEKDFDRAMNVGGRLSRQGSEILIATAQGVLDKVAQHLDPATLGSIDDGYLICLLEPEAHVITPSAQP